MTKTELYTIARSAYIRNCDQDERRLNHCQAWYYEDMDLQAVALVSYRALVAVYWHGVVWEFNRWSNTTTQHVRKFSRLLDAPVVPLYRHSRMAINDYNVCVASDWEDFISEVLRT